MRFRRRFEVAAPAAAVAEFHRSRASLEAITPPFVPLRVERAPERLAAGDEMVLRMWLGPVPVRWVARVEESGPGGFVDRQVEGPFRSWRHRHGFRALAEGRTEVVDEIEAEIGGGLLDRLVAAAMWLGLPALFAFRGWKTRRLLERR